MRLHRLMLEAIGPFASAQEVNFDSLSASGMFLLEGPTGAGKSTVLDAVTFALYGQGPRRESDPGRMQSHYLPPGGRPLVELEFSVGGSHYLISRTPRHERPKRRGVGTMTVEPTVRLARRDGLGNWVEITHDSAEAGTLVGEILGLTRDQFAQVVVLPQGQFAKFLQSDDDQRRALLTRLFGTELFDQVTEHVGERAKAARAELAEARSRIAASLAAALEAGEIAGSVATELSEMVAGGEFELSTMSERLAAHGQELNAADQAARRIEARIARRLPRLEKAAALAVANAARLVRLVSAHQAHASHMATRSDRDFAAAEADAARRAEPLGVVLAQLAMAESRAAGMVERVHALAGSAAHMLADPARQLLLSGLGLQQPRQIEPPDGPMRDCEVALEAIADRPGCGLAEVAQAGEVSLAELLIGHHEGADVPGLSAFVGKLRDAAAAIKPIVETERAIPDMRAEMDRVAAFAATARARVAADQGELSVLQTLNSQIQAVTSQAALCVSEAGQLRHSRGTWGARLAESVRAEGLQEQVRRAGQDAMAAIDAHQTAVAEHQTLMADRIAGMRAELAGMLVAGQACMVCGATEHPAPASRAANAVTESDIQAAAASVEVAFERRQRAELQLAGLREQLAAAAAGTAGFSRARIETELERIAVDLDRVADAQEVVADLHLLEIRWASRAAELAESIAADAAQAAQCDGEYAALASGLAVAEQSVEKARGSCNSVTERSTDLLRLADAIADLAAARSDHEAAAGHLAELTALVHSELRRCGFARLEDARAALRGADELAALVAAVREWDTRAAELMGQLQAPDLDGLEPLDLEQAEKAAQAAQAELSEAGEAARIARAEAVAARRRLERFNACLKDVNAAIGALQTLAADSAGLAELDRLVRGLDGRKRMTLTSFVLRYWFVQVVAAANLRLASMSTGKYELLHSESGDSRRDRVGLGLAILDRHTGQERSTRSLSGGETFYTSLALALGLSDVVAAQAGGVALDTLFIDEGFGSLDPQTLEEVMTVLDELRGNGRVVGVVSHVADLKERIPERIEVRRERPDGPSRLRVIA